MQEVELRKGPWLEEEDEQLSAAVAVFGDKRWDALAKSSGLRRNGKSCRLRWMNYLRPNLKHGNISEEEERVIIELHEKWGNKWSMIARRLPGRTDNEIKNYWRSYLKKKSLAQEKECMSSTWLRSEECETESPCSINDEIVGPTAYSSDALEMLNMTSSSPFETRVTEWMSSNFDTRKTDHKDDLYMNYDLCFSEWISDDYATWDFSLWDGE